MCACNGGHIKCFIQLLPPLIFETCSLIYLEATSSDVSFNFFFSLVHWGFYTTVLMIFSALQTTSRCNFYSLTARFCFSSFVLTHYAEFGRRLYCTGCVYVHWSMVNLPAARQLGVGLHANVLSSLHSGTHSILCLHSCAWCHNCCECICFSDLLGPEFTAAALLPCSHSWLLGLETHSPPTSAGIY